MGTIVGSSGAGVGDAPGGAHTRAGSGAGACPRTTRTTATAAGNSIWRFCPPAISIRALDDGYVIRIRVRGGAAVHAYHGCDRMIRARLLLLVLQVHLLFLLLNLCTTKLACFFSLSLAMAFASLACTLSLALESPYK